MVVVFSSTNDLRLDDSTTIAAIKNVKSSLVTSQMIHCYGASLTEQRTTDLMAHKPCIIVGIVTV